MQIVHQEKEEKQKIFNEKNKKWNTLQSNKNNIDAQFEQIRKKDEYLYAEMVETNKRRKENLTLVKTVSLIIKLKIFIKLNIECFYKIFIFV